jgi:hypothetical protein
MDRLGLVTLKDELVQDCVVAEKAVCLAELRFQEGTDSGMEGCAHHLVRFYNIVEQMALRIAKAFENHNRHSPTSRLYSTHALRADRLYRSRA